VIRRTDKNKQLTIVKPTQTHETVPLKALFMSPTGYFENIARTKVPVYIHYTYIHIYAGNTVQYVDYLFGIYEFIALRIV
jgi:hypothetical protein